VLRRHPFPEDVPRGYLPESVVWLRIARQYKTRFVNEPLRIYYRDQPSLMRSEDPGRHARSGRIAGLAVLNEHLDYFAYSPMAFCRNAAQYVRLSAHARVGLAEQLTDIRSLFGRALWCAAYPVGFVVYLRDLALAGRRSRARAALR